MNIFIEIIGWTGTVMLVLAYLLLTLGKLQSRSWAYQIMNAAGAAAIVVTSFYYGALPGATLNAIWRDASSAMEGPPKPLVCAPKGGSWPLGPYCILS